MRVLYDPETQCSITIGPKTVAVQRTDFPGSRTIDRSALLLFQCDVYVIDSVKSGSGNRTSNSGAYGCFLKPTFDALMVTHQYVATRSRVSITAFASSLRSKGKPSLVIIAGGDTSVSEFVNGLKDCRNGEIYIATIPEGTGNALALSNGIQDIQEAIWRILTATSIPKMPLFLYEVKFPERSVILHHDGFEEAVRKMVFVVVMSWAFHASLVADSDTDEMREHGIERFKIAAKANLARPQHYDGSFEIKGSDDLVKKNFKGPLAYFVVTPAQKFEPKFVILPNGDIHSPNLYIVSFQAENSESYIMDIMLEVYENGKHVKNPKVFYQEVSSTESVALSILAISNSPARRFCVDGAIVVAPGDFDYTIGMKCQGNQVGGWKLYLV